MAEINDWNTVDANNSDPAPNGYPEGTMLINQINNAMRADAGRHARWYGDHKGSIVTAGSSTAYTYASDRTIPGYYDGLDIVADFHVACGAAPTLNVDAVGAAALIWPDGTAIAANDIPINAKVMLRYDGASFQVMSVTYVPAGLARANTFTGINSFTKIQKWAKGVDVGSAGALTLGDDGNYFDITGTTTITSIATKGIGTVVRLHFDAILILTHSAADLVLPTSANITTAAGDEAVFVEYATGDWRCVNYQRADGEPVSGTVTVASQAEMETATAIDRIVTPGRQQFHPSAAKAWLSATYTAGTPIDDASYNVASLDDDGTGSVGVNYTTAMSLGTYSTSVDTHASTPVNVDSNVNTKLPASAEILVRVDGAASDTAFSFTALGDQ